MVIPKFFFFLLLLYSLICVKLFMFHFKKQKNGFAFAAFIHFLCTFVVCRFIEKVYDLYVEC